jgi:hypothetical protein
MIPCSIKIDILRFPLWGQGVLQEAGNQENNNKFNELVAHYALVALVA